MDPRPWQAQALEAWRRANCRGIVEAATGTGKTAVGLLAMEHLHREHGDQLRVAVIVPTTVLADQWRSQLTEQLGILPRQIGELHSAARREWTDGHPVLVAVINSARERLERILADWRRADCRTLLMVDECHRAGSESNAKIFGPNYDYALGLSATHEREDGGHKTHVYGGLGKCIYRYSLRQALDDGVLAPLKSINLYVEFSAGERAQWQSFGRQIARALRVIEQRFPKLQQCSGSDLISEIGRLAERNETSARKFQDAVNRRRRLLNEARERRKCQVEVLEWIAQSGERALVFHETIETATASAEYLQSELGVRVGLDHSGLDKDARRRAISDYREARAQVLVAVRALDEGIDVPDAAVALIGSGSRTERQRIQRFGRVLRKVENKRALVISVLVRDTPEEAKVGLRDSRLIGAGRVQHHRWPECPVGRAVAASASTYVPKGGPASVQDELTLPELVSKRGGTRSPRREGSAGGVRAPAEPFRPNGWYRVDTVRRRLGIPAPAFDRLRAEVRSEYRHLLDPARSGDLSLINGVEANAIRRLWKDRRRSDGRSSPLRR